MATPPQPKTGGPKYLWAALIAVLGFVLVVVLFNPSGDRDGTVQDPIVMNDPGEGTVVGQANNPDAASDTPAPNPFNADGTRSE